MTFVDKEEGQPSVGFCYAKKTFQRLRHEIVRVLLTRRRVDQPPQIPPPPYSFVVVGSEQSRCLLQKFICLLFGRSSQLILGCLAGQRRDKRVPRQRMRRTLLSHLQWVQTPPPQPPFSVPLQVLSIRPDLISDGEMQALQKLCDKVPAFDNALAMRILERELGPIHAIFDDISPEPVAAASLGQVYKARLKENGQTVAVKIQRPSVLETVALDLYICRFFGEKLNDVRFLEFLDNSDLVALVDEFAGRLYRELDYRLECESGVLSVPLLLDVRCEPIRT